MTLIELFLTFVLVIIIFIVITLYSKFTSNKGLETQEYDDSLLNGSTSGTSGTAGSVGLKKTKRVSYKRIIRKKNFRKKKKFIKSKIESLRLKGTKQISTVTEYKKTW